MLVSFYANHLDYKVLVQRIGKNENLKNKMTKYQNSPLWAAMHDDMDTAVGRIVDTVDNLGIRENTDFIYTADNGYEIMENDRKLRTTPFPNDDRGIPVDERHFHKAYPLLSHKYMISEGDLRVPFTVSGPGIPAGTSSRVPVVGWDIFPTVLDIAGAAEQIQDHGQGGSLFPLWRNGGKGTFRYWMGSRGVLWS